MKELKFCMPVGGYNIIYVDPPWDIKRGPLWKKGGPSFPLPYRTMPVEKIEQLPIGDIAAQNSHLYIWLINRYIPDGYRIVKNWGFRPSTLLTWCKPPHGLGIGGAYVPTTEHLLFCRKGKLREVKRVDTSWFVYSRGRHSEKPKEFRDLIVSVSGDLPRIELFAREIVDGWHAIGDEIDGLDIFDSIRKLKKDENSD